MRIALITCLNNRPHISRILMHTFARLNREVCEVIGIACVHTPQDEALCRKYGIRPVLVDHNNAGEKWNTALSTALEINASHVFIMGDDDSISSEGFAMLVKAAENGEDYVGFKSIHYIDTMSDEALTFTYPFSGNKLIGCGAMISRKAIEKSTNLARIKITRGNADQYFNLGQSTNMILPFHIAEYIDGYDRGKVYERIHAPLWPPKGNGLDHAREMRLVMCGFPPLALNDGRVHLADFKSNVNIWPFDRIKLKYKGPSVDKKSAMWFLSEYEIAYICGLNTTK